MTRHELARLTPKDRGVMIRLVVDNGLGARLVAPTYWQGAWINAKRNQRIDYSL